MCVLLGVTYSLAYVTSSVCSIRSHIQSGFCDLFWDVHTDMQKRGDTDGKPLGKELQQRI